MRSQVTNPRVLTATLATKPQKHVTYRIVLLGDSGVGKTSLLLRFTEGTFSNIQGPTIGLDFKMKEITLDNTKVVLQIHDTAGQEMYRTISSSVYRKADGIMLVFDWTDPDSLINIHQWMGEIDHYVPPEIPKILVGNKCDEADKLKEQELKAKEVADNYHCQFFTTSAKTGENVDACFLKFATEIKKVYENS